MAEEKLFNYYERQEVLPTFGNLRSPGELDAYGAQRRELFADKLLLPPVMFRGADLLEFGPDSGENAMVFARWGAQLTLVEPNRQAHEKIQAYFSRFGLTGSLRELVLNDVEGFRSDRKFDIIDAEGFIYTVQPTERWLRILHGFLNPDGYAIVFYYERYGGFLELALKAIHAAGKILMDGPPIEVAKRLFDKKWNSIPHTRSFESWLMDVLENPFVRHRYFIDAASLCSAAHEIGFDIHSAWPSYRDSLDVYWHKKIRSDSDKLQRTVRHLGRSRLSFLGGRKLHLVGNVEAANAVSASIEQLVLDVDQLIDTPFGDSLPRVVANLATLREKIRSTEILADDPADIAAIVATLDSFHDLFAAIALRDASAVAALTQSDPSFISSWGQPAHFVVLRKRPEVAREG